MTRKPPLKQFVGMSKLLTLLGLVLLFGAIVACGGDNAASDSAASSSADSSDEPEKKRCKD